jgi:Na+/H+-dicarboxylate symporter
MACAQDNMGAPEKVWGFTLPLGATVNMNGMASFVGVICVFSCYLYGVDITLATVLQFVFMGLALSIGTAGVKGAGLVMATILLESVKVPTELIIPIIASIYPLIDIGNTTCNVTGDLVGTALVSSKFNMLDKNIFYNKNQHV